MPPRVSRVKKGSGKNKAPKGKTTAKVESVDVASSPRNGYRYEPYRKAGQTPEPEGNLPADPKELESLDATAKKLYAMDREILKYIEDLKRRTAAILEQVNRNDSQLRAANGAMGRIENFVLNWQKMDDHWTDQQLFGDDETVAPGPDQPSDLENDDRNPKRSPTMVRGERSAFPAAQEHLSRNAGHPHFPYDYARNVLGELAPQPPTNPSHPRHPSARPHDSPQPARQPEPPHPVVPHPDPRVPSPRGTVLGQKRKRVSTLEDNGVDGNVRRAVAVAPRHVGDEVERAPVKRPRHITRQPSWDERMFIQAGCLPCPSRADPPTRRNSPEPSPQPAHRPASVPSVPTSQLQTEDSEEERSQVVELISRVEPGESESGEDEPTGNILAGLTESQYPLPALTVGNTRETPTQNPMSQAVPTVIPAREPPAQLRRGRNPPVEVPGIPRNAPTRRAARGKK